jgi:hypothetical protein
MKRLFFAILLLPGCIVAQQIERSVLSAAGTDSYSKSMSLEWTLGELAVRKVSSENFMLTEGYHQPVSMRLNNGGTNAQSSMTVWPNPSEDRVSVKVNTISEDYLLTVTDLNGKIVRLKAVSKNENPALLDLTDLKAGIYFVSAQISSGNIIQRTKICKIK